MNTNRLIRLGLLGQDVINEYSDDLHKNKAIQEVSDLYKSTKEIPVYHKGTNTWYNEDIDPSHVNAVLLDNDGQVWVVTIDDADPEDMKQWAMKNGDWEVHGLSMVILK